MAKSKKKPKKNTKENDDSNLFAFIATFFSIIGFIIAYATKKENKYVMYYAKQSLVIFIFAVIVSIINLIIGWIPIFGWVVVTISYILLIILWTLSWVYSLSGKRKEIPVISDYAKKFNI